MPVRLSAEEAFRRAEKMRSDWGRKKYPTYTALSRAYDVSINYARQVILGNKCIRIDPPGKEGKDWKYIELHGVKYAVYKDGRIWSCTVNALMSLGKTDEGYRYFMVRRSDKTGSRKKYLAHRLVLTVFDRPPKPGEQGRHKDDDPSNNHIKNLRWGYQEDNSRDMLKNGGVAIGEEASGAKLTEKQVLRIVRAFNKQSLPAKTFARQYIEEKGLDIGLTSIREILNGTTWSHVTGIRSNSVPEKRNDVPENVVRAVHRNYRKVGGDKEKFCQAFSKFLKREGYHVGWKTVMKILDGTICHGVKP